MGLLLLLKLLLHSCVCDLEIICCMSESSIDALWVVASQRLHKQTRFLLAK